MVIILKSKSKIFLSALIFFIGGVAVYLWWWPEINYLPTLLILLITFCILIIIAIYWRKDIIIRFVALVIAFLFLGFIFVAFYFHQFLQTPFPFDKKEASFEGYICNDPEIRIEDVRYELCLESLDGEKVSFKILITTDLYPRFEYGETLFGKGQIERPVSFDDFDYRNYLLTKKIFAVSYKPKIEKVQNTNQPNLGKINYLVFSTKGVLFKIKNKFSEILSEIMAEPEASFLKGLILGEKSTMSEELLDNFNKTGTTHIIALSGFNVTIIIFAVASLFGYLGKRNSFFISLSFVIFFVIMTGAASSVVRAAIMVMLVLVAPLLGRRARSINILVFTAFIMILFNPLILRYDLGFALSFLSISGLIIFSPLLSKKFEKGKLAKMPGQLKSPLVETLSAQLFAFPLILYSFSRVSLIAPLTNILILPFIPLTMLLGFIAAVFGMIFRFLGEIFAHFSFFFLKYMIVVVNLTAKIPFSSVEVEKFPIFLTILLYILIMISALVLNRKIIIQNGKAKFK